MTCGRGSVSLIEDSEKLKEIFSLIVVDGRLRLGLRWRNRDDVVIMAGYGVLRKCFLTPHVFSDKTIRSHCVISVVFVNLPSSEYASPDVSSELQRSWPSESLFTRLVTGNQP